MLILVTYDVNTETVAGKKRLHKVAKVCTKYGVRAQNSVFECDVDASQYKLLKNDIINIIDQGVDSVRFYNLGNYYSSKVEHFGTKPFKDPEAPLIY